MIGLTVLTTNGRPLVAPKLNRRRAVFVLSKVEEILSWEKAMDRERDSKFVELGRYLCEARGSDRGNRGEEMVPAGVSDKCHGFDVVCDGRARRWAIHDVRLGRQEVSIQALNARW